MRAQVRTYVRTCALVHEFLRGENNATVANTWLLFPTFVAVLREVMPRLHCCYFTYCKPAAPDSNERKGQKGAEIGRRVKVDGKR